MSPFATRQWVSLGGWLRCHSFVGAPICLIFHLYSGKQRQAAAGPLLLFLRVHLRRSAQPWTTSLGFGEIWPRWKLLLVAPMSRQHMDTCLLSTSPIILHFIASSIKSQDLPNPTTLQLLKTQSRSVITIKHTPFALPHAAPATALTLIAPTISCLSLADLLLPHV